MLTEEQRLLAHVRIMRQQEQPWESGEIELTPLQAFVAVLKDGRTYFFLALYAANGLALTIFTTFQLCSEAWTAVVPVLNE